MQSAILQEAPPQFDHRFLEWLRELEGMLLIRFMDWGPSFPEDAQSYEKIIRQAPKTLKLYYELYFRQFKVA
jgi:hypothetical protein